MSHSNILQRYVWVVLAAVVAIGLALALAPWLDGATSAIVLLLPVIAAGWRGDAKAALGATLLGVIATGVLLAARAAPVSASVLVAILLLYLCVGIAIALIGQRLHATQASRDELQAQLADSQAAQAVANERALRLARAARAAHISCWQWEIASGHLERDPATGSILGDRRLQSSYTIEEAWQQVHPADRPRAQATVEHAIATGGGFSMAMRLQSPHGAARWVELRGVVEQNADHHPTRVAGVVIDIDRHKRAEEALRESEERFHTLVDHASVLLWGVDANGSLFLNRECLRFTGMDSPPAQPAAWWRSAAHPDDAEQYIAQYTYATERRALFEAQVRLKRADGEYRWFKSIGVPRHGREGTFCGYAGCSFDITEMKQYIAELARAEQRLLEADRRKDRFLSSLSHELRNPLSPIRDAASLLAGTTPQQHQFQWAREVIDRQIGELTRVLDELRDVSRIAQSKLELSKQRLDVREVLGSALERSRSLFESKEQLLDVAMPEDALTVDADASRLAQVFSRLLENAAKHTDRGGSISVRAWEQAGFANVAIKDSGAGIAPANLSRIFDIFSAAAAAAAGTPSGLGIGLALARGVVMAHGGGLEARSEGVGKGSEFHLTLPLAASLGDAMGAGQPARRTALRILVADDVQDAAEALAVGLRIGGNEVRIATDGVDAFNAAKIFRPDVAVLDLGMPKLTGYEVARRLRKESWARGLVLIALTGWGEQDDVRRALEVGFNYHMTKPVQFVQLQELVEALAARRAERV
jgi:PAS domain S-box-containing protein